MAENAASGISGCAIGPVRGKLLRNGGLSADRFSELQLGQNFQPLTLEQMQELEPLAFKRAGFNTGRAGKMHRVHHVIEV